MEIRLGVRCALTLLVCISATPVLGAQAATVVAREIVALYDSKHERDVPSSRLHRFAEMPLNHLGFILRYHDVNEPLPQLERLSRYVGVITWFAEPLAQPTPYLAWSAQAVRQGLKYVVLGNPGADPTGPARQQLNLFLGELGLAFSGRNIDTTYGSKIIFKDAMVGFEHDLDPSLPPYSIVKAVSADVEVLLAIRVPPRNGRDQSLNVAICPRGGYAAFGYEFFHESKTLGLGQWIINPFEFFTRSFGKDVWPVPDVTTVSGRRLYFSHVDGDGGNNSTTLEQTLKQNTLAAEVMLSELIAPYPDLPVTIGLIAGDVDLRLGGSQEAQDVAKRIFGLPQVEIGSHTYTHPFVWNFFDRYDRQREVNLITDAPPTGASPTGIVFSWRKALGLGTSGDYVAGSADLPRAYMIDPFDLDHEIAGSIHVANSLAPKGKRTMVLQWSGDTSPFERAVKKTREIGVRNINGGDSRFDASYPSIAYVPPIGRNVGAERQIYAVNSNENTYTQGWTKNFAGQLQLTQTLRNTDTPRRLKGFNIYYHVYSAERRSSLNAVETLLNHAQNAQLTPVTTSHYAAMADGFYTTKISEITPNTWSILDRGELETVRFDNADRQTLDLTRSRGVLGQNRYAGSLYVALDPAVSEAVVALATVGGAAQGGPSLVDSRWLVRGLHRVACGFKHKARGFGAGGTLDYTVSPRTAPDAELEVTVECP